MIANLKERIFTSAPFWSGIAALVVGLLSGVGVWLFKLLIVWIDKIAHLWVSGSWLVVFIPVLGGLMVGLLMFFFVGEERYHGVAGIIEAVALAGGRLRYLRMPVKTLASAISIGSGAAGGPEDPSVQIGANIGSFFGQRLRLSDDRVRSLVAAGAAEEFLDDGKFNHTTTLYEELVRVPLVVVSPRGVGSGTRRKDVVETRSVFSTVLESLELDFAFRSRPRGLLTPLPPPDPAAPVGEQALGSTGHAFSMVWLPDAKPKWRSRRPSTGPSRSV